MKFLFDLFPVILFFGIFKWGESNTDAAQSIVEKTLSGLVSGGIVTAAQAPIILATARPRPDFASPVVESEWLTGITGSERMAFRPTQLNAIP